MAFYWMHIYIERLDVIRLDNNYELLNDQSKFINPWIRPDCHFKGDKMHCK